MDDSTLEHESYGTAVLSRMSGNFDNLFQSGIATREAILLQVSEASVFSPREGKDHGDDHVHPGKVIVDIVFSPLQFAEFITSMGKGGGTPCTIEYRNGKRMESPPPEVAKAKRAALAFKKECEDLTSFANEAEFLVKEILAKGAKMKADDRKRLMEIFKQLTGVATDTGPFLMERAEEHLKTMTAEANATISQHALHVSESTGVHDVITSIKPQVLLGEPEFEGSKPLQALAGLGSVPAHPVIPELPQTEVSQKSVDEMNARDLGILISAHLRRMEGIQNQVNAKRMKDGGEDLSSTPGHNLSSAHAWAVKNTIHVLYVSYHGASYISLSEARTYLKALESGYTGQHFHVVKWLEERE